MQTTESAPTRAPDTASGAVRWRLVAALAAAVVVAAGIALRFVTTSDLWLDEALSVNIARLPVGEIDDALRHDGHPPLYYLILHGWMELFGSGDWAVRALSGVFSLATLPVAWLAARRYSGQTGAVATLLLLVASPFAIRYATEARMYSLVMLLVFAGWLAVRRAWDRPTVSRLAPVSIVGGLLVLTHYWSIYLLAGLAGVLAVAWRRRVRPAAARRVLVAVALSGVLFLPWLPGFLEQARNTGTPWGRPERPTAVLMTSLRDFGGVPSPEGELLGIGTAMLAAAALVARALDGRRLELDLHTRREARPEATVLVATVLLAVVAGYATQSAFASRYMATVFPLLLLLAGLGATRLVSPAVRATVLAILVGLSLVGAGRNVTTNRTQGALVANRIDDTARPGDVVGFCPDQVGPATARYLDTPVETATYPDGGSPLRVDWVDYAERVEAGDPEEFARELVGRAGPDATIWLVWKGGYRTHDDDCEAVAQAIAAARPMVHIRVEADESFESMWLYEYPPA